MPGPLHTFFCADHRRLEALLTSAHAETAACDLVLYEEFRAGLLRHIAMEERILFPFTLEQRGGRPLECAAQLRLDHGAIASLLVPPPSPAIVATLRSILYTHNLIEEAAGGMYEQVEELADAEVDALLQRAASWPPVPVMPLNGAAHVLDVVRRAVERAGHHMLPG
jgi:hypothetical protein